MGWQHTRLELSERCSPTQPTRPPPVGRGSLGKKNRSQHSHPLTSTGESDRVETKSSVTVRNAHRLALRSRHANTNLSDNAANPIQKTIFPVTDHAMNCPNCGHGIILDHPFWDGPRPGMVGVYIVVG